MAVTNGYVQVIAGYNKFSAPINNDGSFNISYNSGNAIGTLTAYDSGSGDSTKPVSINVLQGSVNIGQVIACTAITSATVAGFTYSVSGPFVPVTVAFSNTSTNATSYVWDFGDGTGSTLVNPEHIYSTAGDYTVKLIVTGSSGKGDSTLKILHLVSQANDTYINLTLNGISYSWTSHQYELSGGRTDTGSVSFTSIKADSTGGSFPTMYILCTIRHDNAPAGNVPTGNYPFGLYTVLNSTSYNTYEPNGSSETNVTQYESVGGYITGSATGWIKNFPPPITDSFPFTCTYKVKRIQ
jgi:PKD repeat protein